MGARPQDGEAEEGAAPAEEGEAPAVALTEEGEAPAEGGEAPAEEGEAPAEEGEAPAEGGEAPEGEAPAEDGEAPEDSEAEKKSWLHELHHEVIGEVTGWKDEKKKEDFHAFLLKYVEELGEKTGIDVSTYKTQIEEVSPNEVEKLFEETPAAQKMRRMRRMKRMKKMKKMRKMKRRMRKM